MERIQSFVWVFNSCFKNAFLFLLTVERGVFVNRLIIEVMIDCFENGEEEKIKVMLVKQNLEKFRIMEGNCGIKKMRVVEKDVRRSWFIDLNNFGNIRDSFIGKMNF